VDIEESAGVHDWTNDWPTNSGRGTAWTRSTTS
jgi:hypothetical protein